MEKDTLSEARDEFKTCLEHEAEQRKASQNDLEFALLEKQWDERDIAQRDEEGRPHLVINRLPAFIKQVTNDGRLNRPSINVKPVGRGANKDTAGILSDLIRNIETMSQATAVYDTAYEFAVSCGVGYFRVNVDYTCEDEWDQDISLSRISNPFSVYGDYEGKEATSIDWNRCFVTDWYSKRTFEQRWKGAKAASFEEGNADYGEDWFKDDGKRIRVAEHWTRSEEQTTIIKLSNGMVLLEPEMLKLQEALTLQGVTVQGTRDTKTYRVKQSLITGTDILEENEWLGKYIPVVPMYGEEVNVNGKRYFISLVRRAKDSQRAFNFWRTCAAEQVALAPKAPWIGPVGAFVTDAHKWATANRAAHQYIEFDVVPEAQGMAPQRQPFAGVPVGAMQEALSASDDMKDIMGLHDASLGAKSNETSGRAIQARDRQGDISTFNFLDNRNRAVEHGGRIICDLIPKVYSAERIMRCVQEDGTTYTVPVNQPVASVQDLQRVQMPMGPQQPSQEQTPEQGPPEYAPIPPEMQTMLPPEQLAELKKITKVFDLTTGKYDVICTAGPAYATRREEAAQQMMEFIRIFPQSAPLIGDLLAKNLDWPGSEQVAERLKAMLPPQAQGQVPPIVQQLQQQLQQQDAQAKQAVAQLAEQVKQFQQQLADKAQEEAVKKYDAETKRIGELADAAEKNLTITRDPATGEVLVVPMQTAPQGPIGPAPVELMKDALEHRKLSIEEKRLSVEEREILSRAQALDTESAVQKFNQIDVPAHQLQQQEVMTQAMIAALEKVAQSIQQKPSRHVGKAVKQKDGSFVLEKVEVPLETPDATLQ